MSTEENKATIRRVSEAVNKGNLAVVDEIYDVNFVSHQPGGVDILGRERWKQIIAMLLSAFPDYHETIEDMVVEGDKVSVRVTATGTHKGEWLGTAPTGKQVVWTAMGIGHITGGKVVEDWWERDMLGLMQQLGILPSQ